MQYRTTFPARGSLRGASGFDSRTLVWAIGPPPLDDSSTEGRPMFTHDPSEDLLLAIAATLDECEAPSDYDSAAFTYDPFVV